MASLLTHAALPLLAQRGLPELAPSRRRLALTAALCACLPDLDLIGMAFDVRPGDPLGHRGLSHSLLAAAVIAFGAGALAFRSLGLGSRKWLRVVAFLFAATAAHGVVDALTVGDVGVAFFAPFDAKRFLLPWRLLPVCPMGVPEYLSRWGLLVLANELLFLLVPAFLLSQLARRWRTDRTIAALKFVVTATAWLAVAGYARAKLPGVFSFATPRLLRDARNEANEEPDRIPHGDLPGGRVVTRFDELAALGLFDRPLQPDRVPWSSTFFPWWYGGEAGRWQEGRLRLIGRTLFGAAPPEPSEAKAWLAAAAAGDGAALTRLFTLAPTEKIDLLDGALDFPRTRATLARTHNGSPRYWRGRCNGIAAAAMAVPEPFRVVEAIGRDGVRLRFHPNDVKALLATAYYMTSETHLLDTNCPSVSLDQGASCAMNPAGLVLAVLNRLGLAHRTFLLDALPTPAIQWYAVAEAEVHRLGPPRPVDGEPLEPSLLGEVTSLVDVRIDLTLSSTTLPYAAADRVDPESRDGSSYLRVGLRPVRVSYPATLALGADSELLGGRWNGEPNEEPDSVRFVSDQPLLADGGTSLAPPEVLSWPLIRRLAEASAAPEAAGAVVDLRADGGGLLP
ncbi:MAG: metal-dependent hydrolase [Myxococcales bacterium]